MKIDRLGTKCNRCKLKIRWWQGWFKTFDERSLHAECYKDEIMAAYFSNIADNARIYANGNTDS